MLCKVLKINDIAYTNINLDYFLYYNKNENNSSSAISKNL